MKTFFASAPPFQLDALEILRRELDEAMLLCGCTTLKDIDRSLLTQ